LLLLLGVVPLHPRVASAGLAEIDAMARLPAKRLQLSGEGGGTRTALTGNNVQHYSAFFALSGNTGKDASFRDAAKKMPRPRRKNPPRRFRGDFASWGSAAAGVAK
jgi:hypothetical protein